MHALAEKGALPGLGADGTELEALGVLAHFQARTTQHDAALGHDHPAGEHAGLLEVVVAQRIGLDVHGLVAIGLFGQGRHGAAQGGSHQQGCGPCTPGPYRG